MTPIVQIGWPVIGEHPNFRVAVEQNAARIVAHKDSLRPVLRWLTRDVGRSSLVSRALMWDARDGGVTVSDVVASARQRSTASEGRVLQVFKRADAAGLIQPVPGKAAWVKRRLVFQPELIEAYRARAFIEIDAARLVAPEIAAAREMLGQDAYLRRFLAHLSRYHVVPPETLGPRNASIRLFLEREAGLMMLYDLIGRQSTERTRLLEGAPFSRMGLARRLGVSRSHVSRLFEAAAAAGYLSISTRGRVSFSAAMSEEAERHFALTFHVVAVCAAAAMNDVASASSRAGMDAAR
jgi:DNA-binding GntR family transcriptional regulator